jgi:beta-fructofuranosidase
MRTSRRVFLAAGALAPAAVRAAAEAPNPAIVKAMAAAREAIPRAESDPERPVYHFRPPANWNNDPNGTIFYKGWHHLFYQHNPYSARWDSMHWGHARSRDLVNWEHLPIALWPSIEKGEDHVFSGGAILAADGRPRLFYTSIGKRSPEQWMAVPADDELIRWEKHPANPILTLKHHGAWNVEDWRDPFLFQEAGKTYMVCGGNLRVAGSHAAVQIYEALNGDLTRWKHQGPVFEYLRHEIVNIECPNLFKVGKDWVLIVSPHQPCEYFVGEMDFGRMRFVPRNTGVLDAGTSYASNISRDGRGRTILWLWARTGTDPAKGWNSCMAMPRILEVDADGYLRQRPAPEFESLRGPVRNVPGATLENKSVPLEGISGDSLEIEAAFSGAKADAIGLRVRTGDGRPGVEVAFHPRDGYLNAGTTRKFLARQNSVSLRLFLDRRVLEVYANDGASAVLATVDAAPGAFGVEVFARGGEARLDSLRAWPLSPARFSLDRFRV